MDELLKKLKELAAKEVAGNDEDFNAMDASGGNFDDAYELGRDDGKIVLALQLLPMVELVRHNLEMAKLTEVKQ